MRRPLVAVLVAVLIALAAAPLVDAVTYSFSNGTSSSYSTRSTGTRSGSGWYSTSPGGGGSTWYSTGSQSSSYVYRPVPAPPPSETPGAPSPSPSPDPAPQPPPRPNPGETAPETALVRLINQARQQHGLPPLALDPQIQELARAKSQDLADHNVISHTSPTYGTLVQMLDRAGVPWARASENLAAAFTVEQAHAALMESPAHRRNILDPYVTHVGVGVVAGGPRGLVITEIFVGR